MKILVTGGAGFIGSNFIHYWLRRRPKDEIINYDKLTYAGNPENLRAVESLPNYRFVQADVLDAEAAKKALDGVETVVHFAAESHVTRSEDAPEEFYKTNVEGTKVMLEAAAARGVGRFVHISCYDETTRALTKGGLKTYNQLRADDEVLTLNPANKEVQWLPIQKVIVQDYKGPMIEIRNKRLNLLVTPNHRMLLEKGSKNKTQFLEARELLTRSVSAFPQGRWGPKKPDPHPLAFYYFLGIFIGDGFLAYQEKTTPNKTGLSRSEWLRQSRNTVNGQWQRLGRVGTAVNTVQKSYRIYIDIPEKDPARQKTEAALTSLGYIWHRQEGKSGEHIYLTSRGLYLLLADCGRGAKNKRIPRWALESSSAALRAILNGLLDSDGRRRENGGGVLTTASEQLSQDVSELCAKLGYSSAVKKYHNSSSIQGRKVEGNSYAISIGITKRSVVRKKVSTRQYEGKIWCVKVPPNKNLLIERGGKFAFCGNTDEVYGSIEDGYFAEEDKQPGDSQASSAYAKSKALADDVAQSYFHKLPVVIVRPTNNFGPYQYPEKALPRWITSALMNDPIYVWGEGKQVRDWLFAEDTARALELIINKAEPSSIFNIGANHEDEYTNFEIARMVLKELGKPMELLKKIPDPRADHDFRYGVKTDKIKALGWRPGDFLEQFRFTVAWYVSNSKWWQPLKAEAEALYAKKEKT